MAPPPTPELEKREDLSFPIFPSLLTKSLEEYLEELSDQLRQYNLAMARHATGLKEATEAKVRKEARKVKKAEKTEGRQKEQKDGGAGCLGPESNTKMEKDVKEKVIFWSLP